MVDWRSTRVNGQARSSWGLSVTATAGRSGLVRRWWPWLCGGIGLLILVLGGLWARQIKNGHDGRFDREILRAAAQYGVDPALVKAVVWRESRFDPNARGRSGEVGLMQIRELAAVDWSSSQGVIGFEMAQLQDPATNILAGTWYLARLLKRYEQTDDPVPYALADYNAGRANVRRWIKTGGAETNSAVFMNQIGFPATHKYVRTVMDRRRRYER